MNILPSLPTRWNKTNVTQSGLTFTFAGPGNAYCVLSDQDINELANTATLSAIIEPPTSGYLPEVTCVITVQQGVVQHNYTCVLSNNYNGLYTSTLMTTPGVYDSFIVTLYAEHEVIVRQLSLDIILVSIEDALEKLKAELPTLIEDYNTVDLTISERETTVGLITANLLEATDLEGHFSLSFSNAEATQLTMRIYDDENKCLYSPSIYDFPAGKHTIGFPHAYLKSDVGFHNFTVTLQATTPIFISTRALLYTINASHMAERLMDAFGIIHDITARTTNASSEPTMVYAINCVDNVAMVRHTPPSNIGVSEWTIDFVVQGVKAVAIEFNGSWEDTDRGRLLITEQLPYIFFVDIDGNLYAQHFNNESTRLLLATEVESVAACRAWLYKEEIIDNDMGLIAAYIKTDGKVYYRQFAIVAGATTAIWQEEAELPFQQGSGTYTKIWASRLNDFRMAFTAEDSAGNGYALITRRYYQADSVERTIIYAEPVIDNLGFGYPVWPEIIDGYNETNTEFTIYFNYPMQYGGASLVGAFSVKDSANKVFALSSAVLSEDGFSATFEVASISGYSTPLLVTYTTSPNTPENSPLYTIQNGLRNGMLTQTFPFYAEDFSPKGFHTERITIEPVAVVDLVALRFLDAYSADEQVNVTAIPPSLVLSAITYLDAFSANENIQVSATVTTFVLTKVGVDPL